MNTGEEIPKDLPKIERHTLLVIGACILAALVLIFIVGFWVRHERIAKREKMAQEMRNEKPVVGVVKPKKTQK